LYRVHPPALAFGELRRDKSCHPCPPDPLCPPDPPYLPHQPYLPTSPTRL